MENAFLEQIELLVRKGEHVQAFAAIDEVISKNELVAELRVQISDWLMRIGENSRALKILGAEIAIADLRALPADQLLLQARLAAMLDIEGATVSANRILKNVEGVAKERSINLSQLYSSTLR